MSLVYNHSWGSEDVPAAGVMVYKFAKYYMIDFEQEVVDEKYFCDISTTFPVIEKKIQNTTDELKKRRIFLKVKKINNPRPEELFAIKN